MFNAVPIGNTFYETKRLRDEYGYRDPKDHNLKKLHAKIFGNTLTKSGLWYYFKLEVDREKEQIRLNIYDLKKNLIDNSTYWDFDTLKEKISRKLQVLAIVKAWTKEIDNSEYFNYNKLNIYILKDFNSFITAIEKRYIVVKLTIGNHYDIERYGEVCLENISFCIREENILKIYDIYR